MSAHVEPSCHLVFSVCGYRRGFIIMWSYSEISAERSQAFWKRLNLFPSVEPLSAERTFETLATEISAIAGPWSQGSLR